MLMLSKFFMICTISDMPFLSLLTSKWKNLPLSVQATPVTCFSGYFGFFRWLPRWCGGKEPTCQCRRHVGDLGFIPGWGRSPGGGHGNPLQCSCLKNTMDKRNLVGYSPWGRRESHTTEHTHVGLFRYPSLGMGPTISDYQGKIHHGVTWGEGASLLFWHELFWLCSVFVGHFATNLPCLPSGKTFLRSSGNGWMSGVVMSGTGVYRRPSRRPAARTQLLSVGKLDRNQGIFLAWVILRHVSLWQNQACHGGPKLITCPVLCVGRSESAAVPLTLANHTHCCGYLQNYNVASSKKKEFAVKKWEVSLLRVQETLLDSLHVPLQPILLFV